MGNYFIFNGQSSEELGIKIVNKNTYSSGKRDLSLVSIPGRDGELVNSNRRFANATVSYTCYLPAKSIEELSTKVRNVKKWLYLDSDSYHELTDSYDPDFFRYAIFNSKLDISDQVNKIGQFTITFSAKPFRYLSEAYDEAITVNSGATLFNPYPFASKPLIHIEGSGTITLIIANSKGTKVFQFTNVSGYVDCDSELMNVYKGTVLKNNDFIASEFPTLENEDNVISYTGTVTKLQIYARWMCL